MAMMMGNLCRALKQAGSDEDSARKAAENSRGVLRRIEPRQSVASQLKILMPVGTAIVNDASMKNASTTVGVGVVNMWCAHTSRPRNAIATVDAAIALYPKIGLRANTGRISEIIPKTGRTMM